MSEEKKEKTLEEALEELQGLVEQMQEGNLSLEKSFALYKEGAQLIEFCSQKIEKVESDMKVYTEEL